MISSLELARICGVSQGTVDRALHGRPGVAEATRRKILEAARLHSYSPNPAARELMTGRGTVAGAIIPAGASVFFMDLFEALRKALKRRGLTMLMAPVADAAETIEALNEMASRRLRGVALVPPSDDFIVPDGICRALPVVSLASPCLGDGVRFVAPDEVRTGRDGSSWLWSLGHRRIAFLSYARKAKAIEDRRRGYKDFMRDMGARPLVVCPVDADALLKVLRRERPSALFCHNDWLALTATRALQAAGIRVPEDVSVMGIDDSPTFTALFPGIATMAYPYGAVAEVSASIIAGEPYDLSPLQSMPLEIRERPSVVRVSH